MKTSSPRALVLAGCVSVCVLWDSAPRGEDAQDRYTITALDGISFSEFRGCRRVVSGHDIKHGASRCFLGFSRIHRQFTSIA
jgi:hypothetical protein